MKKGLVIALALVLMCSLSSLALAKTTLKLAISYPPDHIYNVALGEAAKVVAEKTNGEIDIQLFPSSQLGTEEQVTEGAIFGSIDMAQTGAGQIGNLFKPILVCEMPFTFKNNDHVLRFTRSEIAQQMFEDLRKEFGVKVLMASAYGSRHVTSNKPINTPEDLAGFKIRVPEQNICLEYAKAMGADPTPIAFKEVYMALQQGVVDGQENPLPTIKSMKFYEVQKYINLTAHINNVNTVLMNDAKFQSLTEEQQQILLDAFDGAAEAIVKQLNEDEENLGAFFAKEGVTVNKPDVEAFKKATATMPEKFKKWWIRYGEDLHQRIQNL